MLAPIFVKGHVSFTLGGESFEFVHQNISGFGVTGLPWGKLNASEHFGRKVEVRIRLAYAETEDFATPAYIIREYTVSSDRMGLRFALTPEQQERITQFVRRYGY